MFIIVDACFFVMWFGAWSAVHGWGALGMAALWTVLMCVCLYCETIGSTDRVNRQMRGASMRHGVLVLLAVGVWILYFLGLGDWLHVLLPKSFPEGGTAYSLAHCGVLQLVVLAAWAAVRIRQMVFVHMHQKKILLAIRVGAFVNRVKTACRNG